MFQDFYKGKKVFVTGHTGFKGSWLSIWLKKLGAEVTGYSLTPPTEPSMFEFCNIGEKIQSVIGDIRNRELLQKSIKEAAPEIVFHLAAQPLVRLSYENPVETYETNIMGTVNLLESIRQCPTVRSVVVITSDKCYENNERSIGYNEADRLGGYDPYSSSKACQELVVSSFTNSFFNINEYTKHKVAIATARAGNVIGGGDFAKDRLIPDCVKALIKNEKIEIRNPNSVRPWQHVLEPLGGYMVLAKSLYEKGTEFNGAWNFGPESENEQSVGFIVSKFTQLYEKENLFEVKVDKNSLHETSCLKLDSSKSKQLLGYSPKWSLEDALKKIVIWTKAYEEGKDIFNITLSQIEEYENKL